MIGFLKRLHKGFYKGAIRVLFGQFSKVGSF